MDSSFITKFVNQFLCYLTFTCLRRLTYNNHQLGETPKILPEFWYIHSSPLSKLLVIKKNCSLLIIYDFDSVKLGVDLEFLALPFAIDPKSGQIDLFSIWSL